MIIQCLVYERVTGNFFKNVKWVELSCYKVTQLALYAAITVDNNIEYL